MKKKSKQHCDIIEIIMMIKEAFLFLLAIVLGTASSLGGYFIGQKISLNKNFQQKTQTQLQNYKKEQINLKEFKCEENTLDKKNNNEQNNNANQIRYLINGDYIFNLVNKQNALPSQYSPKDLVDLKQLGLTTKTLYLRKIVIKDLQQMINDAKKVGINLEIVSGFRSYEYQKTLYQQSVQSRGEAYTSKVIAKPGHSEHQLGTTIDFGCSCSKNLKEEFETTPQSKWLLENAYKYGFALSYPKNKTDITGYIYEPWHFRYIGKEAASEWKNSGLTLNEFLAQKPQYFKE